MPKPKNIIAKITPNIFPHKNGLLIAQTTPIKIINILIIVTIAYLIVFGTLGLFIKSAINGSIYFSHLQITIYRSV